MNFVEDLAPMFADFAVTATIGAASVQGIFDTAYADALGMGGYAPVFTCAASDVPTIAAGDAITIGGDAYTVGTVEPDGTGIVRLRLEAV